MAGIEAKPTLSKSPGLDYYLPSQVFRHTHDPVLIVMWSSIIIVCRAIKLTIVSAMLINSFVGSEPPKFRGSPNIFCGQILFTFFQFLKTSFNWETFCWLPNKNLFPQQRVNIKRLTWLKRYWVIYEILVIQIPL